MGVPPPGLSISSLFKRRFIHVLAVSLSERAIHEQSLSRRFRPPVIFRRVLKCKLPCIICMICKFHFLFTVIYVRLKDDLEKTCL